MVGRVVRDTWWDVEQGGTVFVGYRDHDKAHAKAKPHGFRVEGTVIRHDKTHSWVIDGDTTVETTTTVRTVEAPSW